MHLNFKACFTLMSLIFQPLFQAKKKYQNRRINIEIKKEDSYQHTI